MHCEYTTTRKLYVYKWFKLLTLGLVVKKGTGKGAMATAVCKLEIRPQRHAGRVWAAVTLERRLRLPVGVGGLRPL